MQWHIDAGRARTLRAVAALLAAGLLAALLRKPLLRVMGLALGAGALAVLVAPLAERFERTLPRPAAALACLATIALAAAALMWLMLPSIVGELIELGQSLPRSVSALSRWARQAETWLEHRLPGLSLPELRFDNLAEAISGIVSRSISVAGNLAGSIGRLSMMFVLSYFFLHDRDRLLLRLELLIPLSFRATAVRMGNAVCRELQLYLRGQLLVALAVGALSAALLFLVGVRSALVLGLVIGLLNVIPYFGPFIGGVPAVLIALGDGWQKAALTVAALTLVQQLDGALISPRILGSLTGLSPAMVLVGIFAGAQVSGFSGMLIALPIIMAIRTLYRVFVQRREKTAENI